MRVLILPDNHRLEQKYQNIRQLFFRAIALYSPKLVALQSGGQTT
jgi:hypothetical protein